jgi:hypothetical protein
MRCLHHRGSPPPQNQINGALIPNWRNLNPVGIRAVAKHLTRRMIAGRGFAPRNNFTDTLVSADAIKVRVFAADSRSILSTEAVVFQVPILVSC